MMIDKETLTYQVITSLLRDKSVTFFNSHETRVTVNLHNSEILTCLRKQPSFLAETTGFPEKWHLRIARRIPYWWCITTQIWVVILISWSKFPIRHSQSKALPRSGLDTSSVRNACTCFSDVISQGNRWWHHKMSAVFSG